MSPGRPVSAGQTRLRGTVPAQIEATQSARADSNREEQS